MQTEHFGNGTLVKLGSIIKKHSAERVLIVSGKNSFHNCGASQVLAKVCSGCETRIFKDFSINPKLTEALSGIELSNSFQPDIIVAVGGGSVIDMGKLITILQPHESKDYESIIKSSSIIRKGIPFVAIPTTAGAGSEATHFAVVYIDGMKYSLAHPFMLPDYSILDPSLTFNSGQYQTAVSAMDALCQAVESYWSVNATTESREYSLKAISALHKNIRAAVEGDKNAKEDIAYGANFSGKAINITKTTAPHAISYALTSKFSIPHGHAVALSLGKFFLINALYAETIDDIKERVKLNTTFTNLYNALGYSNADGCEKAWYELMEEIGLETKPANLGIISDSDYELIADSVNTERLCNHPVVINREIILSLFRSL